jgi:hypothetical protein
LLVADPDELTIASAPPVGRTPPANRLSGTWISALGPVALQLSDSRGRTTGRSRGAVEHVGIPDTNFDQLPEAEFAFTRQDSGYTVDLAAEREGSLDLKVRVLGNGRVERTAFYLGVPLGATGRARLAMRPGAGHTAAAAGWPSLEVDTDGDGVFEAKVRPAAVLDATQSADVRPPELAIDSPAAGRAGSLSVTARWRASDAETGVLFQSAVVDPDTSPRVVVQGEQVALSAGQHQLVVSAVDRAGNAHSQRVEFQVP